jgi:hypothetical protein
MVGCESHKIYSIYSLYTHKMALESHQIPMNPIVVSHDTVYVPIIINQPHLSKNYILICLMAKKSNANTNNGQNTIEQGCSQHPRNRYRKLANTIIFPLYPRYRKIGN